MYLPSQGYKTKIKTREFALVLRFADKAMRGIFSKEYFKHFEKGENNESKRCYEHQCGGC